MLQACRELGVRHVRKEEIGRLRLIDKRGASARHVDDGPLLDFVRGTKAKLDIVGNLVDALNRALVADDAIFDLWIPEVDGFEPFHEARVYDYKVTGQNAARVDV